MPYPVIRVVKNTVAADIVDGIATTVVEQTFANDGDREGEGTWLLPLPAGAVADGFTMTVGGKEMIGEVLDAAQARSVYEAIVRQRRDPGLLEYAGNGLLRARVFPIPARGEVLVKVRLRQVLQPLGGIYEWQWPVRASRLGDGGSVPIGVSVHISSTTSLRSVFTPRGDAEIVRKGEKQATISMEASAQSDDLRVLYGLADREFGLHLMTWRKAGEPGYFAMLLSPRRAAAPDRAPTRRCVQFVIDTSGSMQGKKMDQAKAALRTFVRSLRPSDLFQIVPFSTEAVPFHPAPRLADATAVAEALSRIESLEARGGTNIASALDLALAAVPPLDDGAPFLPQVVFVTDGMPTVGVTDPKQILALAQKADRAGARVFAFGVGDDIDVPLIDDLVRQHRGARDFVRPDESIEAKVDALCQKIAQPAMTDIAVRCDGLDSFEVHPARTTDLFFGDNLQLCGRYRGHGARVVKVTGKVDGVACEFVFEVEFPEANARHDFVPTLWARQQIGALMEAIRKNGASNELVEEVRRLATQYGIATPYTSNLILEEGMRLGGDGQYRGPGDRMPAPGGGRGRGPTTGGPGVPGPSGPATAGPTGPRTGASAVEESLSTGADEFFLGATKRVDGNARRAKQLGLRRAANRSFLDVAGTWVESGLGDDWRSKAVVVTAFSDAYFALLQKQPDLREVFALGTKVAFRDGDRIVLIEPAASEPAPAAK
ncbi:MAG: VWA domain-containing protein [Planctomycetes bacterium]|nr:VWA domain-containing protein [Planctomycetota bacterium]